MSANLESSAVATGLEKVSFHSNCKDGQCQRMFKLLCNSAHPLSSLLFQSFPALGSFQMSQLFISGSQSIGVSASASVLPMNIQDSQESSPTPQFKSINSSELSFLYSLTLSSITCATKKKLKQLLNIKYTAQLCAESH